MTTSEILQIVRLKLLEAGQELVSDTTLLIYANLSYKDIIKKAKINSSITPATISFTGGVGTLPATFGALYGYPEDSNGNIFPNLSIADFERQNESGVQAVTIEGGEIKVSPDTTSSLSIKFYPTYPTLTSLVDPSIDEYLHEPIVYGVLARAFEDLQDFEMAQLNMNKFNNMLKDKLDTIQDYDSQSQQGGQMFNGISILGNGNNNNPNSW